MSISKIKIWNPYSDNSELMEQLSGLTTSARTSRDNEEYGDYGENEEIRVNFGENSEEYLLEVLLPGLTIEEINLSFTPTKLTLEICPFEKKDKSYNFYLKQISIQSFSRTFNLPFSFKQDEVHANLKNGILRIVFKKLNDAGKEIRKITLG